MVGGCQGYDAKCQNSQINMDNFKADKAYFEFDVQQTDFNVKNALFLCKVASLSYRRPEEFREVATQLWNFPHFRFVENSGMHTQAYVIANQEALIVTFRGTESRIDDWVTNADTTKINRFGGQIHKGFAEAMDSVFSELVKAILDYHTGSQKIIFCGHSLGGALAVLTVARLLENQIKADVLYTFGQPRVGDSYFAMKFNLSFEKYYRIVNYQDVVVRIPPGASGFEHAGVFYYLTQEGQLSTDKDHWYSFWEHNHSTLADLLDLAIFGIPEHETEVYIQKLAGNC